MKTKPGLVRGFLFLLAITLSLALFPILLQAEPIGGDPPCGPCEKAASRCNYCSGGSAISTTEGNLREQYSASRLKSAFGPTVDFSLTYNSYDADGSRAQVDTVMGYGWTHSYNIFLFSQRGHMFRMDGDGRVTKYQLGPGGRFTAATGYFESLVKNSDGSFTLRQKDGTVFYFAFVPNTPFLVEGPVFRLISIVDRNNNTTTLSYTNGNLTQIIDTYERSLTLGYNSQNKLTTITDPLGRRTTLAYGSTGRELLAITDPEKKTTQYSYNFMFQMVNKVDRDRRVFSYLYSSQGKPVAIRDGAGANLFGLANPNNWATDDTQLALNLTRVYLPSTTPKTDGRGNGWKYDYDSRGYITSMIAPDNASTTYTYDPATLMVKSVTDANLHKTTYDYDALGNRTMITNHLNHVTQFTYEPVFSMMSSMTDPNLRKTTYAHDERGNRIKETDPLGQMRTWTYDSHGNVLTYTDKGRIVGGVIIKSVTKYEYDAFGNRTKMTQDFGVGKLNIVTTFTYDIVGNMLSRTDANTHTTNYDYDGLNRLIKETDPTGKFTKIFYDGEGNRTKIIDRNDNVTEFQYDVRKRLIKTIDALKQFTTQTFDNNNNRVTMTDKNNHTTNFEFDVQNRLTKITDALLPIHNVSTMTYDGVGNKLSDTDANNHTTMYQHDALNRVIQKIDAEGFKTRIAYDVSAMVCGECTGPTKGSSLITKQTDGNDKVTYFKYDGLDRLILQIRKVGDTADVIVAGIDAVSEYFYDPNSNRIQMTEPNDTISKYQYDALNRRITEIRVVNTSGTEDITRFTFDGVGNVKTVTAPNLNVTLFSHDALDRVFQVDDYLGRVVNYTYDFVGNRLTEKDGNGNGTTNTYDNIYRITDVTDALGKTTHYGYDAVGNLLALTDRQLNITTYVYDEINRRRFMTDALDHTTGYTYDGVGNLKTITDANIQTTAYDYDKINRLIKETYADGRMRTFTYNAVNLTSRTDQKRQTTNYVYNDLYFLLQRNYPVSPADNFTYDLSGRMLTAERGGWLVKFDMYDGANRVLQTTQNGQPITYVYNIPSRTRTLTYPGGRVIAEQKDFRSRLDYIDDGLVLPLVQYTYDLGNRVGTRSYRNGVVADYTYNANNWILTLDHTVGATPIVGFNYEFDNEGSKRFEEKRADAANSQTKSEAFEYDNIYRLIDYKVGTIVGSKVPMPLTQTRYDLDGVGNWDRKTKDGVTETRTHNAVNEITQIGAVTVLSDLNGNTSEDGQYRYNYDEENRLTTVTRKSNNRVVGQYQYDALSRRIKKIADPATVSSPTETRYFYDDARIIEEQNPAMVTLGTYVYGNYVDEVLTMDRGVQTFYYHQNSLWSVEAITNSAAVVVERYAYDAYGSPAVLDGTGSAIAPNPWGTPHSAIGNPWMFTGRQLDEETGLYFYRARYYDSSKGRFLQRDPLAYVDGLNLYAAYFVPHGVDPNGTEDSNGTADQTNPPVIDPMGGTNWTVVEIEKKKGEIKECCTDKGEVKKENCLEIIIWKALFEKDPKGNTLWNMSLGHASFRMPGGTTYGFHGGAVQANGKPGVDGFADDDQDMKNYQKASVWECCCFTDDEKQRLNDRIAEVEKKIKAKETTDWGGPGRPPESYARGKAATILRNFQPPPFPTCGGTAAAFGSGMGCPNINPQSGSSPAQLHQDLRDNAFCRLKELN